ncbi:MAG: HD domain-containing phosphohydrolase [Thermoguttaceae bacterium]|jgi:putative two-component system response regulator
MVKVLVVDDAVDSVTLLTYALKDQGYDVSVAYGGHEALDVASAERPDVILLDVMMPGMNGVEVCRRLKADAVLRMIPVLLVTAKELDEDVIAGLDAGAEDYVTKPFNNMVLAARLRAAVRVKQFHDEIAQMNEQLRAEIVDRKLAEESLRKKDVQLRAAQRLETAAIRRGEEETIHRLLRVSLCRDEETGTHIRRVGLLSEALARVAGWSVTEAEDIRLAAPMHDIGKIGIPDAILHKPGPMSPEEFLIIQTHTVIGAKILAGSDAPMLIMAEQIALNHHEHWDGGGYPAGLAGYAIPESARIVAIADEYDALIHDRVYRPAMTEEKALAIMQQDAGTHFDPLLLAAFFSHLSDISRVALENPDEAAAEFVGECPTEARSPGRLDLVGPVNNPCITS